MPTSILAPQDVTLRLQQLISGWGGAQRGQAIAELHQECVDMVGRSSGLCQLLLPAHILPVTNLDTSRLQQALRRLNGVGRNTTLQFRVEQSGQFDAALIPVGRAGEQPDRWLLAIEQGLPTRDQVALYGHAVGHLLLNYQEEQLGFNPRNRFAHADTLAVLRLLDAIKHKIDRRVLDTFPLLTRLLETPEESVAAFDAATVDLRQRLAEAGWTGQYRQIPYIFTNGRVFTGTQRRGTRLRVDALLRAAPSLPIAIVHSVREGEAREDAQERIQAYAHRLAVPFAYLLDTDGTIQEYDFSRSQEPAHSLLSEMPGRETLWQRWMNALQLPDIGHKRVLQYPYYLRGNKKPRYYQEAAINSAVIAVLQAQCGLRPPRLLITLATGTGKTLVAFQLLWKLKRERAVKNVLFLTDRDFLLSQAMDNEFAAFGDARYRIQGGVVYAYDMNFATYQAITNTDLDGQPLYRHYDRDFFEVIVIDECHRGSSREESQWHEVLDYFSSAIQIGLTATPLSTETVQTDAYFGQPIYSYSLRMGISDGFLAPYRVRRVLIERAASAESEQPNSSEMQPEPEPVTMESTLVDAMWEEDMPGLVALPIAMETPGVMLTYTNAIARHLAAYLSRTDIFAKTIIFCVNQRHAEDMRIALEAACAEWMPKHAGYVTRIVSDEGSEGKRALGNFTTPAERYPVIVTTSRLLSTGVDVPTCKNIVLARPVGSMVEFKQIIGRGTRLFEPQKYWFTILDYAGTIRHFFDPDFDGDPELVEKELLVPEAAGEEHPAQPDGAPVAPEADTAQEPVTLATPEVVPAGAANNASPTLIVADEQASYSSVEVCSHAETAQQHDAPFVESEGQPQTRETAQPASESGDEASSASPAGLTIAIDPHNPPPDVEITIKRAKDGRVFKIIGEIIFELGPDGSTLRRGTYRENAIATIQTMMETPADLRARWRKDEQRAEILDRLASELVDLQELAHQQRLSELDPLDVLLHLVFAEPVMTRGQRVERLRQAHSAFFKRFKNNLLARATLDTILERYEQGEADDVSDLGLLKIITESGNASPLQLAQAFVDNTTNATVSGVLKELQSLLYSV